MTFIIICMLFFIVCSFHNLITIIVGVIRLVVQGILISIESIYKHRLMDEYLDENIKVARQNMMEQQQRMSAKINEEKNKQTRYENRLAANVLDKINGLKFNYPYADPELFDKFINEFNFLTVFELEELENEIKQSHYQNVKNRKVQNKQYNYKDIENLTPLETRFEDPIEVKVYSVDMDYVIAIKNLETRKIALYQSRNYLSVLQFCSSIINELTRIKNQKLSIQAFNIDNMSTNITMDDILKI